MNANDQTQPNKNESSMRTEGDIHEAMSESFGWIDSSIWGPQPGLCMQTPPCKGCKRDCNGQCRGRCTNVKETTSKVGPKTTVRKQYNQEHASVLGGGPYCRGCKRDCNGVCRGRCTNAKTFAKQSFNRKDNVQPLGLQVSVSKRMKNKLQIIESWDLSKQKLRVLKEELVDPKMIDAIELELRKFLALILIYPDKSFSPSEPVDHLWHAFILYTKEYHEFCKNVYGHYLHHTPNN